MKMTQLLVRDMDEKTVKKLKARARRHKRSLQAELKMILEEAAQTDMATARATAEAIRKRLAGRDYSDSGRLQAQDRAR